MFLHIANPAELPLHIELISMLYTTASDQMDNFTVRRMPHAIASLMNPSTQIDVFEIHKKPIVEPPYLFKQSLPHHKTGAISPLHVLRDREVYFRITTDYPFYDRWNPSRIAQMIADRREGKAGLQHLACLITLETTYGSDIKLPIQTRYHLGKSTRSHHRITVQKEDVLSSADYNSLVTRIGIPTVV